MNYNNIEASFEVEFSPEQLHDLASKLEHHSKHAFPGQVVRVKLNHHFTLIYRPVFKTNHNNVAPLQPSEEDTAEANKL